MRNIIIRVMSCFCLIILSLEGCGKEEAMKSTETENETYIPESYDATVSSSESSVSSTVMERETISDETKEARTNKQTIVKVKGKALKKGDTIAITAPAYWTSIDIDEIIKAIEDQGYVVKVYPTVDKRDGYFAGSAEERADELNSLFEDDSVDAILCLRGGYGAVAILDLLDYDMIASHPKLFIGFSDITAIHSALYERSGLVSIHGPVVTSLHPPMEGKKGVLTESEIKNAEKNISLEYNADGSAYLPDGSTFNITIPDGADYKINIKSQEGREIESILLPPGTKFTVSVPMDSEEMKKKILEDKKEKEKTEKSDMYTWEQFLYGLTCCDKPGEIRLPEDTALSCVVPGETEGELIGGNLTVLASLVGTEYEPNGDGGILLIEETGERAYRIDRMLRQLYDCGLLNRINGIVYGEFLNCTDSEFTVEEIITRYAEMAGKPAIKGYPAGHGRENAFLPLGVHAVLKSTEKKSVLDIDESYAE